MRKHAALLVGTFIALALFAGYAVWTSVTQSRIGGRSADFAVVWPFVFGGATALAILTGVLAWLAFHADNRGADAEIERDR